ncbi:hypothetical protein Q8A73_021434 [Channa argus]|nr:hypothetical protein Q8A73_021434 [Channa argus]
MMDHERPTFLMHTRTRQTPMRNEGEREQGGGREKEVMRKQGKKGQRQREQGESLFLLNSLTVVLSTLPLALPQCRAAACINNTSDSTMGTGQTSNRHLPGNHHYGHHHHNNNCRAHTGGIPLPCWPSSPPAAITQRGPPRLLLLDQKRAKSAARFQRRMRREKAD